MGDWMLREILEQPGCLGRVLAGAGESIDCALERIGLSEGAAPMLHLAGCGDMHFAAGLAAWAARRLAGLRAAGHRSMDLRWIAGGGRRLDGELFVAASVSGRTPRTIEAAAWARRAGARTIGITANRGSPLTEAVDAALVLDLCPQERLGQGGYAGYEHQIAQTKSFTAALALELALARSLAGADPGGLAALDAVPGVLACFLEGAMEGLEGVSEVVVLGSGPWLPLARYGAAKQLEFAIAARSQCLEEYNHLEAFVAGPKTLVVYLALDAESTGRVREIAPALAELGVRSLVLGDPGPAATCPGARGLLLPEQGPLARLFQGAAALQLMARSAARLVGRDPDRWLGGVRTETMNRVSLRAIRASRVLDPPPHGSGR